ncbi:putative Ig domain-containing protein [Cereibacter sphaeroides]|uniref:RCC1 domain-containing protein n=1 Tax=Cereibacter sphaeroides TaxID=1063 RepID=UPI001F3862AA|nr:putative Ig domain-containing protein [Cereibacter sphaeroides]MCE6959225.1 putative Ig domain-containing protein [Cereibacter sphaeroides]MCE6972028.1 putative Ig domain-containing protein [Cereibacter sphaeroides]
MPFSVFRTASLALAPFVLSAIVAAGEPVSAPLTGVATGFSTVDTMPDPFVFEPIEDAEPGYEEYSDWITIDGLEVPVTASVTGDGEPMLWFPAQGQKWWEDHEQAKSRQVSNGQNLYVSVMPTEWETTYIATVTAGGRSGEFRVTTGIEPRYLSLSDQPPLMGKRDVPFTFDFKTLATAYGGPKAHPSTPETLTWTSDDPLPPGLDLDEDTGVLSGTPTDRNLNYTRISVTAYNEDEDEYGRYYYVHIAGTPMAVKDIRAGSYFSCALTAADGVKCWGRGFSGQLGNGELAESWRPVAVSGLESGVAALDVGETHACALLKTGEIRCWGVNASGQLGDNTLVNSAVPVTAQAPGPASANSLGSSHSCALIAGAAYCWGQNTNGQLGDNSWTRRRLPVAVYGPLTGVASISAGAAHTCAIMTSDGSAKCWGWGAGGGLGNGANATMQRPVNVMGLTGLRSIAAGANHNCAVTGTGAVKCWGENTRGALGDGTNTNRNQPVDVVDLPEGALALSAGGLSSGGGTTCALTSAHRLKCWGLNYWGRLGSGDTIDRNRPVEVVGLEGVISVSTDRHTCATLSGGTAKCWGENVSGVLGDGFTGSMSALDSGRYSPQLTPATVEE